MFSTRFLRCGLFLTLFFIKIFYSNAWRSFEIKLSNMTYYSSNENLQFNVTLNDSVFDSYINLKETIPNLYVRPEVYLDVGNGKYDFEFMNRAIDFCEFLRNKRYEPFLQIIYKEMLPYGNFPTRCPILKQLFYIQQFRFNTEALPPAFPERKASVMVKFFKKINRSMEPLGQFSFVVSIEKTYKSSNNGK